MSNLRLRFVKNGRAIYISHLDLMHTMQRAFNRAGYELSYSEGFNPHPHISIAMPLSVGAASECEIMDFRLKNEVPLDEMPERLTAAMPEGIRVLEVYEWSRKASQVKWLEVKGVFEYDNADCAVMAERLTEYYASAEIPVEKKTKRGFGTVDIKPGIRNIRFEAGEQKVLVSCLVSAIEPTINPDLLVKALEQNIPELSPDFAKFTRIETYDAEMKVFR